MKKVIILLFVFVLLSNVFAEIVKFKFEGYINIVEENTNDAMFYVGQQIQGTFSYSLVPDQSTASWYGVYHQDASLSVTLDTDSITYLDRWVYIRVCNDYMDSDRFSFGVDASYEEYGFTKLGIELIDSTANAFNSDSLPTNLDLLAFDSTIFNFKGYKSGDWFDAEAQVTKLTLIPEPCSVLLLGLGGLALLRRRRRER